MLRVGWLLRKNPEPEMENQMEQEREHEMKTGII